MTDSRHESRPAARSVDTRIAAVAEPEPNERGRSLLQNTEDTRPRGRYIQIGSNELAERILDTCLGVLPSPMR
jgi:hypothetical protein